MAEQNKKLTATTKPLTVKLRYDADKKKLQRPKSVTLVIEEKNEIFWTCKKARLEINFDPKDTPFLTSRFRGAIGGGALSGVPSKLRAKQKTYTYTVTAIAMNKPNSESKKRCSKVRLVCPVKEGKALPTVEGTITIQRRKAPTAAGAKTKKT